MSTCLHRSQGSLGRCAMLTVMAEKAGWVRCVQPWSCRGGSFRGSCVRLWGCGMLRTIHLRICCQLRRRDIMELGCDSPASIVMTGHCRMIAACTSGMMHQEAAVALTAFQADQPEVLHICISCLQMQTWCAPIWADDHGASHWAVVSQLCLLHHIQVPPVAKSVQLGTALTAPLLSDLWPHSTCCSPHSFW